MKSDFYLNSHNANPIEEIPVNGGLTSILENVVVIGDSLAAGELHTKNSKNEEEQYWSDMLDASWPAYISRDASIKVANFSRGGMCAKEYIESYAESKDFFNIELYKGTKAYIIALGVNDFINYHQQKEEFKKYYEQIILKYKEISPNARFFLCTMPKEEGDFPNNEEYKRIQQEALYEMASKFEHTYVIDLYKYLTYSKEYKEKYWHIDHHNVMGYRLTAYYIEAYIDYIIRNNPKDFALFPLMNMVQCVE